MGHSLGFKHSGKEDDSYADESGYMGYAVNELYSPRKAFNAHKHWISGWFDNRAIALEQPLLEHGAVALPVVSFVDASREGVPEKFAAVVRIGDLYLHYNRAKGYNNETSNDQKDLVTITSATNEIEVSYFAAALAPGETYSHANYDGNGTAALVIQVCDLSVGGPVSDIDYATISIHLEDGVHTSRCGNPALTKANLWTPAVTANSIPPTTSPIATQTLSPTAATTFDEDDSSLTEHPAMDLNSNIVQYNPYEPEVLVEDPRTEETQPQQDHTTSSTFDRMLISLLAVAGFLFLLAGGVAYCMYWCNKDQDDNKRPSSDKTKKSKLPPDLDLSETEDSERDDEDFIVEIRRIPLSRSYMQDQRFCEI